MKRPHLTFYALGSCVTAFSSTRHGGVSQGNYASFNINLYCGDCPSDIQANRQALAHLLGIKESLIIMPHQVHGTEIVQVDRELLSMPEHERTARLDGVDAVMTSLPNICIGVSTADCIPILLYDAEHEAVCAVHAGWRGTVARIATKAVTAMREAYSTRPSQLHAVIGPGISLKAFEVGDEVYRQFAEAGFDMETISQHREKWHLDLPTCNHRQLTEAGIPAKQIHVCGICTFQHADDYFSARRLGTDSGRIFNGIMLHATS